MVAFQWSQSVQKIGLFSPCFLFLRIFRSTLLNNLCLHTLQGIDVSFLCEYSDSHCFTIYACTHCNNTYNMDLQRSHFNDLSVQKIGIFSPCFLFLRIFRSTLLNNLCLHTLQGIDVSFLCEYSDSHCFTIYACTHCNNTYNMDLQRSHFNDLSVQKIGIFSPCFLFLRIFRSTLLNNLCLHTLQ